MLRYLAVAHFGRGRGKYVEGEAPPFWSDEVEQQFGEHAAAFRALWDCALEPSAPEKLKPDLQSVVAKTTIGVLQKLYPATVPIEPMSREPSARAYVLQ